MRSSIQFEGQGTHCSDHETRGVWKSHWIRVHYRIPEERYFRILSMHLHSFVFF